MTMANEFLPGDAFTTNLSIVPNVRLDVSSKVGHTPIELLVLASCDGTSEVLESVFLHPIE